MVPVFNSCSLNYTGEGTQVLCNHASQQKAVVAALVSSLVSLGLLALGIGCVGFISSGLLSCGIMTAALGITAGLIGLMAIVFVTIALVRLLREPSFVTEQVSHQPLKQDKPLPVFEGSYDLVLEDKPVLNFGPISNLSSEEVDQLVAHGLEGESDNF